MSRISERPAVVPFNPFQNVSTGVGNTSFGAIPATGAQPATGTGSFDPGLATMVGQKFDTQDGRELVLVRNGTVAAVPGKVYQAPAQVTAFQGLAMTVPAATPATAGSTSILVTNGATVLNVNQYQGGYLITASGTGAGQILKIASHQAAATTATFTVTLQDPIQTTLDATTTVTLAYNPYDGVILNLQASPSASPVGVCLYNIPASTAAAYNATTGALTTNGIAQYGFLTSHGPTAVLIDTTTTVGYGLGTSTSVAGALAVQTLTASPMVGISMQTQVDTKYGMVYMML